MTAWTKKIALSRLEETEWYKNPNRTFLEYRDLGASDATGGRVSATVAKAVRAYEPGGGTPRHIHELDFHTLIVEENPGEVLLPLRDKARFRLVRGDYSLVSLNPSAAN